MSKLSVQMDDPTNHRDGYRFYYSDDGTETWVEAVDLGPDAATDGTVSYTITGLEADTEYNVKGEVYTEHTSAESSVATATTFTDAFRTPSSHLSQTTSSVEALVDVSVKPESHSDPLGAATSRVIDGSATAGSHASGMHSGASRIVSLNRFSESYVTEFTSYTYNDRASLELIDHRISFNKDEAFWHTTWYSEAKILGNEDEMVLRSFVVDEAAPPVATIIVQYDANRNGIVDEESEDIEIGTGQEIHEVVGLPVSEEGRYRMKIMEYSGYNTLYGLNTAIVH